MTGTVVQFPPRSSEPSYTGAVEALKWYAAKGLRASTAPPVDATGTDEIDAYTAAIFNGLCSMPNLTTRIAHLHDKATEQDRHRARLDLEGHPGSAAHARTRDILRKWASELSDAATASAGGEVA